MFIMPNYWCILVKDGILQSFNVNSCLPCEVTHTTERAFNDLGDVLSLKYGDYCSWEARWAALSEEGTSSFCDILQMFDTQL